MNDKYSYESEQFEDRFVDFDKTEFEKYIIVEDRYDNIYEYRLKYSFDIKFKDVDTKDTGFNKLMNSQPIHDEGTLVHTDDKRPKQITSVLTAEELQQEDIDDALKKYTDSLNTQQKFDYALKLFGKDLPKTVFEKALMGTISFKSKRVSDIDYDYRKIALDKIIVKYEDGSSQVVELPHKVTNKDFYNVTGHTQPFLYDEIGKWLKSDYEGAIKLLNELFGINLETLKGATIK